MNAASTLAADGLWRVDLQRGKRGRRQGPALSSTCSPLESTRPSPIAPLQRREYDSTDDFDDSLPTECLPADFYKVNFFRGVGALPAAV